MNQAANKNRDQHAFLDAHITKLLPRALPPCTSTPVLFAIGILPFAYIFNALEDKWESLGNSARSHTKSNKIYLALTKAQLPGLARSDCFRKDTSHFHAQRLLLGDAMPVASSLSSALVERIRQTEQEPCLLLAHIYVWYMAVLSGGRYMLETLRSPKPEFWGHESPDQNAGFSFLCADPRLKGQLKKFLEESESKLSDVQRTQVVQETEVIYDLTIKMVNDLEAYVDEHFGSSQDVTSDLQEKRESATDSEQLREAALQGRQLSQGVTPPFAGTELQTKMKAWKRLAAVAVSALVVAQLARFLFIL